MKHAIGAVVMAVMAITAVVMALHAGEEIVRSWNEESNGLSDFFALFGTAILIVSTGWVVKEIKRLCPEAKD